MVILHWNLNSHYVVIFLLFVDDFRILFVKVSWCSWNEKVKSLSHQWGCDIHCLAGRSSHCRLKHICESNFMLSSHSSALAHAYRNYLQVARILLFVYMFYHAYLHFDQVITTDTPSLRIVLCLWCFCSRQLFILKFWSVNVTSYLLLW